MVAIQIKEDKINKYKELGDLKTEQDLELLKEDLDKYDELACYVSGCHENVVKTLNDTTSVNDFF